MSLLASPESLDPRTLADIKSGCGVCEERPKRWSICDYHEGYEAALEQHPDVIKDITDRIERGTKELDVLGAASHSETGLIRIMGKIEGLLLVKDWLRSYA